MNSGRNECVNECMMTKDVQLNLGHFGVGCRRKVLTGSLLSGSRSLLRAGEGLM